VPLYEAQRTVDGITALQSLSTNKPSCYQRLKNWGGAFDGGAGRNAWRDPVAPMKSAQNHRPPAVKIPTRLLQERTLTQGRGEEAASEAENGV